MKALSIFKPLAAAALLATAGLSQAAITSFATLASWQANVGASGVDAFTGFSSVSQTPSPITRTAGSFGYTAATVDPVTLAPAATGFFGGSNAGNAFLSSNTATDGMLFNTFSPGVAAIGGDWFASNISGAFTAGSVSITVRDSLGASVTTTITPGSPTAGSFAGFVSNGLITSLLISSVQPATGFIWPSADNLRLAAAVPEASTYAMMLAGLGALGFMARRRRQG